MTDYLNPDKIYPDDISRRIDIPPGLDSVRGNSDQEELSAYRATGLTPEQVMQLASQANGDMAPIPFADHVVEYDGEWYGISGIPGLLEESE